MTCLGDGHLRHVPGAATVAGGDARDYASATLPEGFVSFTLGRREHLRSGGGGSSNHPAANTLTLTHHASTLQHVSQNGGSSSGSVSGSTSINNSSSTDHILKPLYPTREREGGRSVSFL